MRRGFNIAFTGAGGTGKTTTANKIAQAFDINQMKSAAREVYERKELTEEMVRSWTPKEKWALQLDIFKQKVKQDDFTTSYVADRSLLDHWAYCMLYCSDYMTKDEYVEYEALVRKHMLGAYTHVFYFPWGYWEAGDDGVRQQSPAWQDSIDAIILAHIVRWNIPIYEVPQVQGPGFRANFVAQVISGDEHMVIEPDEVPDEYGEPEIMDLRPGSKFEVAGTGDFFDEGRLERTQVWDPLDIGSFPEGPKTLVRDFE